MSNMNYFEKGGIIHLRIKEGREVNSVEILKAGTYLRDSLLDTIQAKLLDQRE